MAHIDIDLSLCNKDGLCISECPAFLLTRGADKFPVVAADAAERCILCGHCIAVCPTGALSLAGKHAGDLIPLDPALGIAPEAAEQFLRSRRSVRRFKSKPVEHDLVRRCIDSARFAPSGVNTQPVNWIVAEDPDLMVLLVDLDGQVAAAPALFHALCERLGGGRRPHPAQRAAAGGGPRAQGRHGQHHQLRHRAHAFRAGGPRAGPGHLLGRAVHPLGRAQQGHLRGSVHPESHKIYGALMLGRPKYGFKRLPERKRPPVRFI